MATIIKPTVGRVVWFYPHPPGPGEQARAAIIAHAWGDTCVNLAIFDVDGIPDPHPPTSVPLIQDGSPLPTKGYYCTWMPFQIGQAAAVKPAAPA